MKLYKSKRWLELQLKTKNVAEIATECGVDVSTINRQIKAHKIR